MVTFSDDVSSNIAWYNTIIVVQEVSRDGSYEHIEN